ncbi:MAG TPA: hypothetical protein VGS07_00210 [Thermoanaerobaculia bacterium]|nr:hypothetical protein [Thermoanaerobaculia bacterium]
MAGGIVWINTNDYNKMELLVCGLGYLLWVIAYGVYIRDIIRFRYVEMPAFAGACDVGWEFTWTFLLVTKMGWLFRIGNGIWFFLDIGFIFTFGVLRYGWKQLAPSPLQKRIFFVPACIFVMVFSAIATYFLGSQGMDNEIGARSAYLIQLCISFLYLVLMLRQTDLTNFSYAASWLRSLGSALVVVFFYMHYQDRFLCTIGTTAAMVDGCYLYCFKKKKEQLARAAREPQAALGLQPGQLSPSLP